MNQTVQARSIVQMDDLVEEVCWILTSRASVARIGFVSDDGMQILPINITLIAHTIVFRTARGSMLDTLSNGAAVVVEIDDVDVPSQTGWSVIVRGTVERMSPDLLPFVGNSVHPWAHGDKDEWLLVRPQQITGRAISHPSGKTEDRLPYMALD